VNTFSLEISGPRCLLAYLCLCAAISVGAGADDGIIPENQHPWARFRPGSWKQVKVTTETFDKDGKSLGESVTETYTRLISVDASGYELQTEVTVDIAGKRFPSQPRVTRHGLHGETDGQRATIRRLGPAALKVADQKLTAQSAEIETDDKESRRVTQLRFGAGIVPYVLARRSLTFDKEGKVQQETDVQTLKVQIPRIVLGMRLMTWETRTTQKYAAGTVVTDEVHCLDVPGGVIAHTSQETDDKGVVLRKSKLELVNYGLATAEKPQRRRHGQSRRSKR
jgi:hypothetical protein